MSLREALLQKLANSPSPRRTTLSIPDEGSGWSVGVTTDRRDEIGCVVWELGMRFTGEPATRADADLTAWADRIAGVVSGLLEPLKVVEIDSTRNEGMLRSDPPSPKDEHVEYYELMLQGTKKATMRRYVAKTNGGERREQLPFTLTNEVLANLVSDLAGTR
jgi:hypothetical protein